jgi:hypothetical protein
LNHKLTTNNKDKLMKKIITLAIVLIAGFTQAQQGKFEEGMGRAFALWGEGKSQEASDLFERIASAEKGSWLPNYYVALVNTTQSFMEKDKEKVSAELSKAQSALDIELAKDPNNSELWVMQAMIYTAWVVYDPMTNGMKLTGKVMEAYGKAQALSPENPRAVFGKAEYEMNGAKYFGKNCQAIIWNSHHPNIGFDCGKGVVGS